MPDIAFLFSFFIFIPLLFITSIILTRKKNLSPKEVGIELVVALLITVLTAYTIQGPYMSYVLGPVGTGHGWPYYYRFTNVHNSLVLPGTKQEDVQIQKDKEVPVTDISIVITGVIQFWFNMIFWFFIISVVYSIFRKKKLLTK